VSLLLILYLLLSLTAGLLGSCFLDKLFDDGIIDEINRGNVKWSFGEPYFSKEAILGLALHK
jgi:hypothetical protein